MKRIIETRNGWEMSDMGMYWSISFPIVNPTPNGPCCSGVHTGTEKYIRNLWKNKYRPWSKDYSGKSVNSLLTRD